MARPYRDLRDRRAAALLERARVGDLDVAELPDELLVLHALALAGGEEDPAGLVYTTAAVAVESALGADGLAALRGILRRRRRGPLDELQDAVGELADALGVEDGRPEDGRPEAQW